MKPLSLPVPREVLPRSYCRYRGDCTSPTTVYSLWAKCSRSSSLLSSDRYILLPMADFPKLALSATHSPLCSGIRPDTSFRVFRLSVTL